MTFKEFKETHPGGYNVFAAEDIMGFAKKGQPLYGDVDNMEEVDFCYQPLNGIYSVYLKDSSKTKAEYVTKDRLYGIAYNLLKDELGKNPRVKLVDEVVNSLDDDEMYADEATNAIQQIIKNKMEVLRNNMFAKEPTV